MLPTPYVSCDYNKVYEPSEDSFLLLDALEKELPALQKKFASKLSVVCEVGCGSGIVTTFMMQNNFPNKYAIYIPTDINPWALESMTETAHKNMCLEPYLSPAKMDLASSLRPNQVDVLVFNPPYVPAEGVPNIPPENSNPNQWLDLALLGGDDGMVVTQRLLDDLDDILSPDGAAYILFCARNKPEQAAEVMRARGWKTELVEHRKAGWEVLSVYKFHR